VTGVPNVVAGSAASFTAPVVADPGEAFNYGINIDWLGMVVEAVTGVGLDEAFTSQIGDLDFPAELPTTDPASTCEFNAGPGFKWGYGLLLNTSDFPGMRRAWSGAWAGLCNTQFWVDRSAGVCGSIYGNFLPFVTPESMKLYNDFERALYASL
jgi:CubicO group peptidase (beta-lactamase class C family)